MSVRINRDPVLHGSDNVSLNQGVLNMFGVAHLQFHRICVPIDVAAAYQKNPASVRNKFLAVSENIGVPPGFVQVKNIKNG